MFVEYKLSCAASTERVELVGGTENLSSLSEINLGGKFSISYLLRDFDLFQFSIFANNSCLSRCSNLADFIFSFSASGLEELFEEAEDEDEEDVGVVDEGVGLDPTVVLLGLRLGNTF